MKYPDDFVNKIIQGDCLEVMKQMPDNCVDSIVTDPPAGIGFMGKEWDSDKGGRDKWIEWLSAVMVEAKRILKPGGHALVWALPRTSHWTGTALENAGFEVRDCIYHLFGSGFPKSLDIAKQLEAGGHHSSAKTETNKLTVDDVNGTKAQPASDWDNNEYGGGNVKCAKCGKWKISGNPCQCPKKNKEFKNPQAKQWEGWGTALKPAVECWWLVRKPLSEKTVAGNVLKHRTGGINIDESRIGTDENIKTSVGAGFGGSFEGGTKERVEEINNKGRFPANLIHDGSDVILKELNDEARFFYTAKPSSSEKNLLYGEFEEKEPNYLEYRPNAKNTKGIETPFAGTNRGGGAKNFHPTVKAQSLMSYLIKLITPPKGIVLDMFAGSGSTCLAAKNTGFRYIGIEIDPEYCKIAEARMKQGVLDF